MEFGPSLSELLELTEYTFCCAPDAKAYADAHPEELKKMAEDARDKMGFDIPESPAIVVTEHVPPNQIVLVGPRWNYCNDCGAKFTGFHACEGVPGGFSEG